MAITNRNTTQAGMSYSGRTGAQAVKLIPAPRVYVSSPLAFTSSPPVTLSAGNTPAGWQDLGSVLGAAKINYTRKVKDISTGLDGYYRGSYTDGVGATIEFALEQFDDVALEIVSGLSPISFSSSYSAYGLGTQDLTNLALLLVVQDKLSGKEIQFYNPTALINFSFEQNGDALVLKCVGYLPYFSTVGRPDESCISVTFLANTLLSANSTGAGYGGSLWGTDPYGSAGIGLASGYDLAAYDSSLYGV